MVDLHWKPNMVPSDLPNNPPLLGTKLNAVIPPLRPVPASDSACSAYDRYLRLPELQKLWSSREFPDWENEPILKPALQALEITFRFVSTVLLDPRPYANRTEWKRRLESLATSQIRIIALLCEDADARDRAPIVDLSSYDGILARDCFHAEVWKPSPETTVVNRFSKASFLARLASWETSEKIAGKILYSIETEMRNCPYSLGLGEPNFAGKPNLDYDAVCRPNDVHSLKKSPCDQIESQENQTLYTTHQILESWIQVAREVLKRLIEEIESEKFETAASDCNLLERIWKILSETEDLHLLMDPDDFLRLKHELLMRSAGESEAFCFRSRALVELTKLCKELRHKVPEILSVEADPRGGPRIQEAAMRLYGDKTDSEKIHLLQGLQAVEAAVKKFFYGYKQMLVAVIGSLVDPESCDSLSQLFLEPSYFPSLDAAKTFLGDMYRKDRIGGRYKDSCSFERNIHRV